MPDFTPAAAKFWRDLGPAARDLIATSAWCGHCRGAVEIIDFGGEEKTGGLLLRGTCKSCGSPVSRYVEGTEPKPTGADPVVPCAGTEAPPGNPTYTPKQGQYLAFIHYYTKVNGCPPAEADLQRYFQVSPPTVHTMLLALEKRSFISRVPGRARSISLNLQREELPDLE